MFLCFLITYFQNLSNEHCVVFVVSTSGQGEMPASIRQNWRILCCKTLPKDLLQNVSSCWILLSRILVSYFIFTAFNE